jgi:predicted secreted protein
MGSSLAVLVAALVGLGEERVDLDGITKTAAKTAQVTVRQGDQFTVRISCRLSTGYRWHVRTVNKAELGVQDGTLFEDIEDGPGPRVGGREWQVFRVKALKSVDVSKLVFYYRRSSDPEDTKKSVRTVEVKVE